MLDEDTLEVAFSLWGELEEGLEPFVEGLTGVDGELGTLRGGVLRPLEKGCVSLFVSKVVVTDLLQAAVLDAAEETPGPVDRVFSGSPEIIVLGMQVYIDFVSFYTSSSRHSPN